MAAAVKEQQHNESKLLQRQEAPAVDETTARALKDPYFFSGMTPQEQRPVFAMVLRSVVVGERGEPIQPQPRMS
jgi:hypothetical protein